MPRIHLRGSIHGHHLYHRTPEPGHGLHRLRHGLRGAEERPWPAAVRGRRLGQISDETQTVLDRFGFQPPKLLNNVRTQVRDLDYDTPATLSAAATISRAWRTMQKDKISAIPWPMRTGPCSECSPPGMWPTMTCPPSRNPKVGEIPVYNLLSVLEGHVLNRCGEVKDTISGAVSIALPTDPGEPDVFPSG